MKFIKLTFSLLFAMNLGFYFLLSYADCDKPNDMDKECTNSCKGENKGCYLPPVPDADTSKCPDDFPKKTEDKICCCKEKE